MREIVLATHNLKKVREIEALLADLSVRILSLKDFPEVPEIAETGTTFAENAEIKARAAADATGRIALADDSGLEVDALGGEPGVYSSRFAGPDATDRDRYMRVLDLLNGVPEEQRTARFRAAISIAAPEGGMVTVEDSCEGRIAESPRGEKGFGYDPIFYIPEMGRTMAQLSPEEKNRISHRGKALSKAREALLAILDKQCR